LILNSNLKIQRELFLKESKLSRTKEKKLLKEQCQISNFDLKSIIGSKNLKLSGKNKKIGFYFSDERSNRIRSFQLKKPLANFSKIKNHIIFYNFLLIFH
jgi:hypothetical protein